MIPFTVFAVLLLGSTVGDDRNDPPKRIIRGSVLDGTTGEPIAGANVKIGSKKAEATTALDGSFAARIEDAGEVGILVEKPGYVLDFLLPYTAGNKDEPVVLKLFRSGVMTGRIIDAKTRTPVKGISVNALRVVYKEGRRFPVGGGLATTDAEGRFTVADLLPGDYYIESAPDADMKERVLTVYTERDVDRITVGYPRSQWPGPMESATPVPVGPGVGLDCGDITIAKAPAYRLQLKLTLPECTNKHRLWFQVLQSQRAGGTYTGATRAFGEAPCPKAFLVTGLQPGRYYLEAMSFVGDKLDDPFFEGPVDIVNANQTIEREVLPGLRIDGKIIAPDNTPRELWTKVTVGLRSIHGMNTGSVDPVTPDPDGKFVLPSVHEADWRLAIDDLGPALYVKSVLYNGHHLSGSILRPNPNSMMQTLVIELGDKPAFVTGVIERKGDSVPKAVVGLVEASTPEPYSQIRYVETSSDGAFRFEGLAPGEYKVIAVPLESRFRIDFPGVLEALIRDGEKVVLTEAQSATVRLSVATP